MPPRVADVPIVRNHAVPRRGVCLRGFPPKGVSDHPARGVQTRRHLALFHAAIRLRLAHVCYQEHRNRGLWAFLGCRREGEHLREAYGVASEAVVVRVAWLEPRKNG